VMTACTYSSSRSVKRLTVLIRSIPRCACTEQRVMIFDCGSPMQRKRALMVFDRSSLSSRRLGCASQCRCSGNYLVMHAAPLAECSRKKGARS
jgi:hypothetical protein